MDKKFIKSMVAAIAGLSIVSSCSAMGSKDSHKCGGKNSCKGKAMEDSHKCGAKNGCAAAKSDSAAPAKATKAAKKKN